MTQADLKRGTSMGQCLLLHFGHDCLKRVGTTLLKVHILVELHLLTLLHLFYLTPHDTLALEGQDVCHLPRPVVPTLPDRSA